MSWPEILFVAVIVLAVIWPRKGRKDEGEIFGSGEAGLSPRWITKTFGKRKRNPQPGDQRVQLSGRGRFLSLPLALL